MTEYVPIFTISVLALLSFCYLLKEKPIDNNNTLFFAAVIVILYIVGALCLTPRDLDDKVVTGLISIGSALVGFISHGILEKVKKEKTDKKKKDGKKEDQKKDESKSEQSD